MNLLSLKQIFLIALSAVFLFTADSALTIITPHIPGYNIAHARDGHGGGDHGSGHGGGTDAGSSGAEDGSHDNSSGDQSSGDDNHDGGGHDSGADGGGHDHDENSAMDHHDIESSQHGRDTRSHDHGTDIISHIGKFLNSLFSPNWIDESSDHVQDTLLGINIDQATISEAENSGLKVEQQIRLKNLDLTVTMFQAPNKENVNRLSDRLHAKGLKNITLNHYYRLDSSLKKEHISPAYPNTIIGWPVSCALCGLGIRIGMVDSYVNARGPILGRQRIVRKAFENGVKTSKSDHGTAIASILVGSRSSSFCGLLPNAILYSAAAFSAQNSDLPLATSLAIVRSLDWLIAHKVQVINLSFSGPDNDLLKMAVNKTIERGVPVIAAAGNNGNKGTAAYPAAYPGVIGVTAIDQFNRSYRQANQGDYISFAAPGVRIPVPDADGKLSYKTGTSYATPYCTALVAQFIKKNRKKKNVQQIVTHLKKKAIDLGEPGKDPVFGWGLIQSDRTHHKN